jgi:fumarate hydratase subunit alpha
MRELEAARITEAVRGLYLNMNCRIGDDVKEKIDKAVQAEPSSYGRRLLEQLTENFVIAETERIPLCQDTGMAIVFVELGQELHIVGGDFEEAVNQGVREAYEQGYFRKSIVDDPLFSRVNTRDNTPAVIHLRLVPGEQLHIEASAKGFGSENMSRLKMLVPADGPEGVLKFIVDAVQLAGPNPCPPVIVGVGVGGSAEVAMRMAKHATMRPLGLQNRDPRYSDLEQRALEAVNKLGIGPGGLGGYTTALGVHIESAPTHIAGMPVAVNMCCYCARQGECVL